MKPLSDADIMKGLKNVNKQLLGIVRLNSYDSKYTFSWKLISCKFINAVSDAEICIWLFSFLKAKGEADWQFQGCLWMKLTTLLVPICRNKCFCRQKSVSRINSKWVTWWIWVLKAKTQHTLEKVVFYFTLLPERNHTGENQDLNLHNVIDHIPNVNIFSRFFSFASSSD